MTTPILHLPGLALNAAGTAPEWIQLLPAGPSIAGRDGRRFAMPSVAAIVAAFASNGADLPVDINHSTQIKGDAGEASPAVGWIRGLEERAGALWGRVEWTADGAAALAARAYRYISPAFLFEKASGAITSMVSAGLTNTPNLQLPALNARGDEETTMDKAVLQALGLPEAANAAEAVVAINALTTARDVALNTARHPDPAAFVPRADHELAVNRIATFEAADRARAEVATTAAVDAAIAAGKVAPSSREYHLASCRAEGGLARFEAMVGAAPVIAAPGAVDRAQAVTPASALTAEELAVCKQLRITPEDFATAKSA